MTDLLIGLVVLVAAVSCYAIMRPVRKRHAPVEPVMELPPAPATGRALQEQTLLAAFRSDEFAVPSDASKEDQKVLQRALQLLVDHVGAYEAVLWQPFEEDDGHLLAVAWSRGSEPPALSESDRLLVGLSADGQRTTFNPTGQLQLLSTGVRIGDHRGAVSVHFREAPTMDRTTATEWLQRHGREIAALHEVVRTRATLAQRTNKLRAMIRTATTLQGSRDPMALEQLLGRDACVVTGAAWAIVVRWYPEHQRGVPTLIGHGAPEFGSGFIARQGSLVGEVCRTGNPKVLSDARILVSSREHVFTDVPLPSGTRSLVIVPLRRSEKESAIGALVLGHPERNALSQSDARGAMDLGTIAAGALETAWTVQDETKRALTDQLTGLPNRRAFEAEFQRMVSETDRYGGSSALVIADVDHFKQVNDTFGHEAGDLVLQGVANALSGMRRATDHVMRLGGEELALLLPQTDQQGAMEVAERCRRALEAMVVRTPAGEVRVTASFGVAMYVARSNAAGRLYERADKALYAAKHGGRNRVELSPAEGAWSA